MRKFLPFILIILSALFLSLIWFKDRLIMGGGESGLLFYNVSRYLSITRTSWVDINLGTLNGILVASSPTYALLSFLGKLGIANYVLQALTFSFLFASSGVAIYFLTKELFPKLQPVYLIAAVFFYWFNPFSMVNVWNRFLYNYMFFWAFLPVALVLFIKGIKKKNYSFSILTGFSSLIFSFSLSSVVFSFLIWFVFFYTAVFFFLTEKKLRRFVPVYFVFTLVTYILFNFWWLNQLFSFVFSSTFTTATDKFFSLAGNLSTLSVLSQKLGSFANMLRFMHGTFFVDPNLSWVGIFNFPPFVILEFGIIGIIFWSIYRYRRIASVLFLSIFFIIVLFLAKGSNPPFGEFFEFVFAKIPSFQVFRNPFEKIGFLLPLVAAPLFAFGFEKFGMDLQQRRFGKFIFLTLFSFIILVWGFPFLTGLVFTSSEGTDLGKLRTYKIEVPNYYSKMNEWFKNQSGNFRFISLPIGGESITYSWNNPYLGVELSGAFFETPNVSFNTTIPFYNDFVTELSKYQISPQVLDFLPFVNGKYIIWRSDVDFKKRHMADPQTVKQKLDSWAKDGLLTKLYEVGNLAVYEVESSFFWPKIYTTRNIISTNSNDISKMTQFILGFPKEKFATIESPEKLIDKIPVEKLVITPEREFTQRVTSPLPKDLSDADLLSRLFYVQHLPTEWSYPFIRLKEKLEETSQGDYFGWVIYKIGILGKRAVEVYELKKNKASPGVILSAESDYMGTLKDMDSMLLNFVGASSPISDLIKNSLMYQWILFDRVGSRVVDPLATLLTNWGIKPKFELPVSDKDYMIFSFDIPTDGTYKFSSSGLSDSPTLFLDGKQVVGEQLELKTGKHEIASLFNNSLSRALEERNILFNEKSFPSWAINIPDIPTTYHVSFDYRFTRGDSFDVKFLQDIDEENLPILSSGIRKEKDYHSWKSWDKEFTTSEGAKSGVLKFTQAEKEVCKRQLLIQQVCTKEKQNFEVEIRNLKVSNVSNPDVYLTRIENKVEVSNTTVDFVKLSPTEYSVKIAKNNGKPEVLVFSEVFNPGWEATYGGGMKIPEDHHFLVNNYANGWIIDRQGVYNITIEFAPERLLEKGRQISIISGVIGAGLYVLHAVFRRMRYVG